MKEAPSGLSRDHTYDLASSSLAPSLVSLGSLGTIYEGVSFFIGGGNVVAIDFMLNNVFNNFAYSCDQRTKQGWRNAGFTQGVSIP